MIIQYDKEYECCLIIEFEEISTKLEESLITLTILLHSKYNGPVYPKILKTYKTFKRFNEAFEL